MEVSFKKNYKPALLDKSQQFDAINNKLLKF